MSSAVRSLSLTVVCPFGAVGGGAEDWLLSIIDSSSGLKFGAVLLREGPLRREFEDRRIPVSVLPTGRELLSIAATSCRLRRLLRARPPDVVVGNGVKAQLAAAPAARSLKLASVWVKHDHSFDRFLAKPLGGLSTLVVATAKEVGEPTGRRDVVVIEPARPAEPLPRMAAVAELSRHGLEIDGRPTLAMITRLVPYKGVDVAVRAMAEPGGLGWRLVVIGQDDQSSPGEARRLVDLARECGVADRVSLLGRVRDAGRLLRAFTALAVLTRPDGYRSPGREGFGIAAAEAMLAGLPVVYAGPGPIADRIRSRFGVAGVVVPPNDPVAVGSALARLSDPELRHRMGLAARRVAEEQPDANAVAASFVRAMHRAYEIQAGIRS